MEQGIIKISCDYYFSVKMNLKGNNPKKFPGESQMVDSHYKIVTIVFGSFFRSLGLFHCLARGDKENK